MLNLGRKIKVYLFDSDYKMMSSLLINTITPICIVRKEDFNKIVKDLEGDHDLLITGVPGSGRHILIQEAAVKAKVKVLTIDFIKAINKEIFIKQFSQTILRAFNNKSDLNSIKEWHDKSGIKFFNLKQTICNEQQLDLVDFVTNQKKLIWKEKEQFLFEAFKVLIDLLQILAESLNQRVCLILENFAHIHSWDRSKDNWAKELKDKISIQPKVSYVIVSTNSEINNQLEDDENHHKKLIHIKLNPLSEENLKNWISQTTLSFDEDGLKHFLSIVEGHFGYAETLLRRLKVLHTTNNEIGKKEVNDIVDDLLNDTSAIFESLLLLLPPTQVQILECLALNPTKEPYSRKYTREHNLLRGGSLQNAILGLQEKGLLSSSEENYRITLPLLTQWIKKKITH